MKQKWTAIFLILILSLSACSTNLENKIDKGNQLIRDREYDSAIKEFEEVIEKDETQYEAYIGLTRAYLRDDEYNDAEGALRDLYKAVIANYSEENQSDYEHWFEELKYYANQIKSDGLSLGSWYNKAIPSGVDTYYLPYNIGIGDNYYLPLEDELELYYTLDGSTPTRSSTKYSEEGITFSEAGEVILSMIAYNEIGISSDVQTTYIDVYEKLGAPIVSPDSGSYDHAVKVYINNYDDDTMWAYYTLDGSNPIDYGSTYYESDGIELYDGDYELQVILYDIDTEQYSDIVTWNYSIDNQDILTEYTELNVGIYDVNNLAYDEIEYALSDVNYYEENLNVFVSSVSDIDTAMEMIATGELDAIFMPAMHAEDFVMQDLLAPAVNFIDFTEYDYVNKAYDAGFFDDNYFALPVVIDPDLALFVDTYEVYTTEYSDWSEFYQNASNPSLENGLVLPHEDIGYFLFSFYLGFDGTLDYDTDGSYILSKEALVEAIDFVSSLPTDYDLSDYNTSVDDYLAAIEDNTTIFALANQSILYNYDEYYYYSLADGLPLPNERRLRSVNNVNGLHVGKNAEGDENLRKAIRIAYRYLAEEYYANEIAEDMYGLPAISTSIDPYYLDSMGALENYEAVINNNLTIPYTYTLMGIQQSMSEYYSEVISGNMTSEEAADKIISSGKK